jgi:hypothetical protein
MPGMKATCMLAGDDMLHMYEKAASGDVPSYAQVATRGYTVRVAHTAVEKQPWVRQLCEKLQRKAVRHAVGRLHEGDWPAEEGSKKSWNKRVQVCTWLACCLCHITLRL